MSLSSGTGNNLGPLDVCYPPCRSPPMDSSLYAALLALGITITGALGTLVTLLVERIKRDLAANTKLTQEAKEASNGRLRDALDQLAAERDRTLALRELVRERDDRLAYLSARLPECDRILRGYSERRQTARYSDSQELAALERALQEPTRP